MSNTEAAERDPNPVWADVVLRARSLRTLAGHGLQRLDPFVLAACVWVVVYLALSLGRGPQPDGPPWFARVWSIPAGLGLAVICRKLGCDNRLSDDDETPWRTLMYAGLLMSVSDVVSLVVPEPVGFAGTAFVAIVGLSPVMLLAGAALLFRSATDAPSRSHGQYLLDQLAIVIVAALSIWFFILDTLPPTGGWGMLARGACGAAAVGGIAVLARIALRPTVGLSPVASTVIVMGGALAIFGLVATAPFGPHGVQLTAAAEVGFVVFRGAMLIGTRLEMRARSEHYDLIREYGHSPLFFVCVGVGLAPLALLLADVGTHYLLAVVACLALSGLVVIRQYFVVREAIQADRARRKSEARFGWLVMNSSDLIMAVDPGGTIDYVSPSVERLVRTPIGKLLGSPLTDLAHPDDVPALRQLIDRALRSNGKRVSGEWRLRQADGSWLPVETVASSGANDADAPGVVLNTRDLQERKALEQKLTFQAFHDPLTRLANRSLFRERVEHALDRRRESDTAVLFIDLDNFKTINDSLGHAAGDHVLVETAHRLRSTLRTEDTAARLGGDEFAVLLEDADVTAAARVAERIRVGLGVPFWVLGQEVYISASIGIAIREPGDTAGELLRNADVAMYTAKTKGKSRFEIFEPAMHDAVMARLGLEAELRRAIDREEFVVHYQPIVKLETGEVIGAEALVRWQHPTKGLIPPLQFIPLAEETGLIVPLGSWILRRACNQLAEWQRVRGGGEPFVMSVNLSSRQLVRDAIADEVAAAVDDSGIRASWLVLEVTETVLMADPVAAARALGNIRDLGVRVALDDFGSGYSSLSHLRRFPIDIVKIDKSFVDDVTVEGAESAIARGIIELGRAMKIQTVAEGIEADEQAEVLRSLGCELGQGFFFAKPLLPEAWAGLLRTDLAEIGDGSVPETAGGAGTAEPGATAARATGKRRPARAAGAAAKPEATNPAEIGDAKTRATKRATGAADHRRTGDVFDAGATTAAKRRSRRAA
jgi:diguanylate cyclase (GGDEF)-like protein/PAS domain S-box-containing protein